MDHPAEQEDPEDAGEDKEEDRGKEASLDQLSQTGDEETRQRGDDITSSALAVAHGQIGDKVFYGCRDSLGKC